MHILIFYLFHRVPYTRPSPDTDIEQVKVIEMVKIEGKWSSDWEIQLMKPAIVSQWKLSTAYDYGDQREREMQREV